MTISKGEVGPHFDEHEMATGDRVQQPGTLIRDPHTWPQDVQRQERQHWAPVQERASDRFACHSYTIDSTRAFPLLPYDPSRKIARIRVISGANVMVVGDIAAIDNAVFAFSAPGGALPLTSIPNVYVVTSNAAAPPFEYTSKAPLWACAAGAGITIPLCMMVERFDSGTPVT